MNRVSMRDVFSLLSFEEDWQGMTDQQPVYSAKLGNVEITASQVMSLNSFQPVFALGGFARTPRTLRLIKFDCPLEVESIEQGVALIAHAIGDDVEPEASAPWLMLGRKWQDTLPWAKRAEGESK